MKKENTATRLKKIMSDKGLRQVDILNKTLPYCEKYDVKMNKSDISQYCSGKTEPNQDKLFVLGKALNVNEAWLMGYDAPMERSSETIHNEKDEKNFDAEEIQLTVKDERDIAKSLSEFMDKLESQEGLMFDGNPASPEAIESIISAMQIGMEMAKKKNKEKYTPKKHRKD